MEQNIRDSRSCRTEPNCARSGRFYQAEGIEYVEDSSLEQAPRLHAVSSILIEFLLFFRETCVGQGTI